MKRELEILGSIWVSAVAPIVQHWPKILNFRIISIVSALNFYLEQCP